MLSQRYDYDFHFVARIMLRYRDKNNNVVLGGTGSLSLTAADKMTKNISPPQKRFNFFMRKEGKGGGSKDPYDLEEATFVQLTQGW